MQFNQLRKTKLFGYEINDYFEENGDHWYLLNDFTNLLEIDFDFIYDNILLHFDSKIKTINIDNEEFILVKYIVLKHIVYIIDNDLTIKFREEIIKENIKRKRLQILVNSYIYYNMNTSYLLDYQYDKICKELIVLQNEYPALSKQVVYYHEFKDFNSTTGFNFKYDDFIIKKAIKLINEQGEI